MKGSGEIAGQYSERRGDGQATETVRRSALDLLQEAGGLLGTLRGGLLEPEPRLGRLVVLRLAIQAAKLQLRLAIAGTGRLAQQLEADAPVPLAGALAAEQAPQPALRLDHALTRRLLEQPPGDALDALIASQVLTVEQPQGHAQR